MSFGMTNSYKSLSGATIIQAGRFSSKKFCAENIFDPLKKFCTKTKAYDNLFKTPAGEYYLFDFYAFILPERN